MERFYDEGIEQFCPFCDELDPHDQHNHFNSIFPELRGLPQILYETEDFIVVPDLGAIVPGHVLIVPKEHYISYASLPKDLGVQLAEVRMEANRVLGPSFDFEHGTGINQEGRNVNPGNSVFHAHLQIQPIEEDKDILGKTVEKVKKTINVAGMVGVTVTREESLISLVQETTQGRPYLFLRQGEEGVVFIETETVQIPSQFLRRISAELRYGFEACWDWKKMTPADREVFLKRIKQTYSLFDVTMI